MHWIRSHDHKAPQTCLWQFTDPIVPMARLRKILAPVWFCLVLCTSVYVLSALYDPNWNPCKDAVCTITESKVTADNTIALEVTECHQDVCTERVATTSRRYTNHEQAELTRRTLWDVGTSHPCSVQYDKVHPLDKPHPSACFDLNSFIYTFSILFGVFIVPLVAIGFIVSILPEDMATSPREAHDSFSLSQVER